MDLGKTAPEAIQILEAGDVVEASLDHGFGEEAEVGTGYDVLLSLEERAAHDEDEGRGPRAGTCRFP